ncbi:MAG: hypothetical protein KAI76_07705 [Alphaproteobacteria bacterium]|nr:hypothetical protein [Alphaproteobacteria bacterium]
MPKNKPKKSANETELDRMREWLIQQIRLVNNEPSPSKQIFKLAEMEEYIDAKISEKQAKIKDRREDNFRSNKLGLISSSLLTISGVLIVGAASALTLPGLAVIALSGAGIAAASTGLYVFLKSAKSAFSSSDDKKLENESSEFTNELSGQKNTLQTMAKEIVNDNVTSISTSEEAIEILKSPTVISKIFTEAAFEELKKKNAQQTVQPTPHNGPASH